ncbi:MAG: EAL domain-containing protein, partial [Paracoccus sp. (in: a-proteobacteria)]
SKSQPNITFINGSSGAQATTLVNPSPNFFRFNTEGAQWMVGLGDYALNDKKYKKMALIAEDYAFPYSQVQGFMAEVQGYGISLALDDFGAGYTSFRYLRDFCFDMIKIDGQFIRRISASPDNQVLTRALQSIAHHFDMFTVAESVETAEDASFLIDIGIDCLQGYYFGAPTIAPPWKTPPSLATR